jgi:hypothetical protein
MEAALTQSNPNTDSDFASALDVAAEALGQIVNAGGSSAPAWWGRERDHRAVELMIAAEALREEIRPASTAVAVHRTTPKRRRKPSIATLVKRAEKTGRAVTSITTPDGTTIHFGENTPSDASNPWLADIAKATKQ